MRILYPVYIGYVALRFLKTKKDKNQGNTAQADLLSLLLLLLHVLLQHRSDALFIQKRSNVATPRARASIRT